MIWTDDFAIAHRGLDDPPAGKPLQFFFDPILGGIRGLGRRPDGPAWTDDRIADAVEVSADTVGRVRQRFVEDSLDAALDRKKAARPTDVRWRHVMVTDRRTAKDFVEAVRWLAEDVYPNADRIVLVMDNLNTHKLASLYEAFPPEQARRIAARIEVHHTPKHGSWLNVAEIKLSVLARQRLDRRIASVGELFEQLEPWEVERNDRAVGVVWRLTTADARIKLKRLYPAIE